MRRLVFVPMFLEPHKVLKFGALQEGIVRPLVANGGEGFCAIIVPGVDLNSIVKLQDDLKQAVKLFLGTAALKTGAANTANKERVTRDELAVTAEQTDGIQIVPGREQHFDAYLADLDLITVVQLDIRVDAGLFVSR